MADEANDLAWETRHVLVCHVVLNTAKRAECAHFERPIHHHSDNCVLAFTATWILCLLQWYAKQSR
jgi:hypothetical protein